VQAAAKDAIERFGTSASASRLVSGQIPLHRELEARLAGFIGTEDCVTYVSGHACNVTTLGHLLDKHDAIFHDEHIHNSVLEGCRLSGARRYAFLHNDVQHLERLLHAHRKDARRALIVVEGIYSMDGDVAPLPQLLALKQRHDALLMVDEAHSIGVLGAGGRGLAEHCGINPSGVDLWTGTLSKALASCGGYVAGSAELIEYLRYTSPGFVYSVGMAPASAAAALSALQHLQAQPQRVRRLHELASQFACRARQAGLRTGLSCNTPIVPVLIGSAERAMAVSHELFTRGVQVAPLIYPAVGRNGARLRFFITQAHDVDQIERAVDATAQALDALQEHAHA
jgi:8-amino-7-oxononanoate synthase